jgi:small subunit ribosomal protein S2
MLTNWQTVRASLLQLHRLEREQESGHWQTLHKKEATWARKRLNRLERYFGGLKGIRSVPGIVIVVGQKTELVAIHECRKLGIPVVCRLDTDCDPDLVEIGVPINDDSTASIRLFLETILPRVREGRRWHLAKKVQKRDPLANYKANMNI